MGQERIIHAALLGTGTVGSGVYKLVKDLEEEIISKTGARLVVDKILVRDTTKAREGIPSELLAIVDASSNEIISYKKDSTKKTGCPAYPFYFRSFV